MPDQSGKDHRRPGGLIRFHAGDGAIQQSMCGPYQRQTDVKEVRIRGRLSTAYDEQGPRIRQVELDYELDERDRPGATTRGSIRGA